MGYSGYIERICTNQHYYTTSLDATRKECPYCRAGSAYEHEVDTTNGYGEREDGKFIDENAPKSIIRYDPLKGSVPTWLAIVEPSHFWSKIE